MIQDILPSLEAGKSLDQQTVTACVVELMSGRVPQPTIETFLTLLHRKGETVEEVVGAALALRQQMIPAHFHQSGLVDTCGTGGDGSRTFNVSTSAAIVAAAAGAKVAKHGNRKITSQSGSADVLSELGVEISCDVSTAQACLDQAGVCFLFAPQFHPAMKHVAAARKSLPFPTIFNLLGPLANPASAEHQLLGVGKPEAWDLLVPALAQLTRGNALAVRGDDGLGELSVLATNQVAVIQNGQITIESWDPADYGLAGGQLSDLQVETPAASAALIREILHGQPSPARNMVVWNAAAALLVSQNWPLDKAILACQEAIDSEKALATLERLVQVSRSGISGS